MLNSLSCIKNTFFIFIEATPTSLDSINCRECCIKSNMIIPLIFMLTVFILTVTVYAWLAFSMMFNNIKWPTLVIGIPTCCCYGGIYVLLRLVALI